MEFTRRLLGDGGGQQAGGDGRLPGRERRRPQDRLDRYRREIEQYRDNHAIISGLTGAAIGAPLTVVGSLLARNRLPSDGEIMVGALITGALATMVSRGMTLYESPSDRDLLALAKIRREEQYIREHRQRMLDAAQRLGMKEEELPDQNTQEWSDFASKVFGEIVEEYKLEEHEGFLLGDILREGINHQDIRGDNPRSDKKYKALIDVVLIRWRDRNNE